MRLRRRTSLEKQFPLGFYVYEAGELRVIMSRDMIPMPSGLEVPVWHISVSCAKRYPTWDEIKDCWQQLKPDLTMAMYFPGKGKPYVNTHKNTFHLWEVLDPIALSVVSQG